MLSVLGVLLLDSVYQRGQNGFRDGVSRHPQFDLSPSQQYGAEHDLQERESAQHAPDRVRDGFCFPSTSDYVP